MKYIVINPVRERTAPNTDAFTVRTIGAGEELEFSNTVMDTDNNTWGLIAGKQRAFVAIKYDDTVYCSPLTPPDPDLAARIRKLEKRLDVIEDWAHDLSL